MSVTIIVSTSNAPLLGSAHRRGSPMRLLGSARVSHSLYQLTVVSLQNHVDRQLRSNGTWDYLLKMKPGVCSTHDLGRDENLQLTSINSIFLS